MLFDESSLRISYTKVHLYGALARKFAYPTFFFYFSTTWSLNNPHLRAYVFRECYNGAQRRALSLLLCRLVFWENVHNIVSC